MQLTDLTSLLDDLFLPEQFKDGCHNGLVIPGSDEIHRILLGVSLTRDLLDRAVELDAQALLVHHGLFLSGNWSISSSIYPVIKQLMGAGIALFAYHLPMDAHLEFSHNRSLSQALGAELIEPLGAYGMMAILTQAMSIDEIISRLPVQAWAGDLGKRSISGIPGLEWNQGQWVCRTGPDPVSRIALVSGRGAGELEAAALAGAELFITGEISAYHPEMAAAIGINLIALGHELSEIGGLHLLAAWLRKNTRLEVMVSESLNPL